ncbi:MAG: class I SAM-dependent methyltransferase [Candidatus Nitrohelix vancouverensis]|uniref:Class I SAM-dependent methyltransferase n=1 Tax=Candidatus Nitrohelix vancouverensis TaxID=2705534 RepID=A0A7T0C296_9BACT|nr:MAG: class I SAM-dependent methyltransferase [Candidatus Nitrohelix vancouverensis]
MSETLVHNLKPCECCGSLQFNLVCERSDANIWQCQNCALESVNPLPDASDLKTIHRSEMDGAGTNSPYYLEYFEERQRRAASYEKIYRSRLDLIERTLGKKGSLLDLGCGAGFFIRHAQQSGWETQGLDILPEYEQLAKERLNFDRVRCAFLEDANLPPASFDVVTLWDLIEHIPHPLDYLRQVNALLKMQGLVVLWTPNVKNSVYLKSRWTGYGPTQHIHFFSRATLERLLNQAGFKVVYAKTNKTKKGLLIPQESLSFEKIEKPADLPGRIGFAMKRDLKNFFNPLTYLDPILDWAGYGFNLLMIARKTRSLES